MTENPPTGRHHLATEVVNLTPHPVVIVTPSGNVRLDAATDPARLASTRTTAGTVLVEGIAVRVSRETPAEPQGLPDPVEGRLLVVSRAVAERYPLRRDLVFPIDFERDPLTGEVVACGGLGTLTDR